MKKYFISILAVLLFVSLLSTQKSFGQIDLNGKWSAKCVIKPLNILGIFPTTAVNFCRICNEMIKPGVINLFSFEMDINKDTIKLIADSVTTQVIYKLSYKGITYKRLENGLTPFDVVLKFPFQGKHYKFKIFYVFNDDNIIILKHNNRLIILEKKK